MSDSKETKTARRGRTPKYDTSFVRPGRPPRTLRRKVGDPIRFLVTLFMKQRLEKFSEHYGITMTATGRLMLYVFLIVTGQMNNELLRDGTFEEMRNDFAGCPPIGDLLRKYHGKEFVEKLYEYFQENPFILEE